MASIGALTFKDIRLPQSIIMWFKLLVLTVSKKEHTIETRSVNHNSYFLLSAIIVLRTYDMTMIYQNAFVGKFCYMFKY